MSLIKNLIKEPEIKSKTKNDSGNSDEEKKPKPIIKSALDLQRLKLEKLMKNPDKPVIIPEHRKEKDFMQSVPTFVRNVMGSSAGAGSGEFHVYRHLRRKEYARQKMIQSKSHQELLDEEYQEKLEENRRIAEEKTAKKRAKRLKKKGRAKRAKQSNPKESVAASDDDKSNDSQSETEENETKDTDSSDKNEIVNEVNNKKEEEEN
ncbi:PRKR-interacting protein 1 homolog [Lucilia sericata]|uniref:PRKR-interacting protein 1 homolog n=1 Tax=Lucilia sericata TaxID=13632 RepID=UPI0018A842EE|nr:PRKR-interacting protein 1 homolog [Lucilia sericata]